MRNFDPFHDPYHPLPRYPADLPDRCHSSSNGTRDHYENASKTIRPAREARAGAYLTTHGDYVEAEDD